MPKRIHIPEIEEWDPVNEVFINSKEQTITIEHSLVSISKWESKWHKAFLGKTDKTPEELADYIRCMTITQNVDPKVFINLPASVIEEINEYIQDPATATHFFESKDSRGPKETVTSELIYYWMITFGIPFECEKWHLNHLLALIQVCSKKNSSSKMSKNDIMRNNRALNEARRKSHRTKG